MTKITATLSEKAEKYFNEVAYGLEGIVGTATHSEVINHILEIASDIEAESEDIMLGLETLRSLNKTKVEQKPEPENKLQRKTLTPEEAEWMKFEEKACQILHGIEFKDEKAISEAIIRVATYLQSQYKASVLYATAAFHRGAREQRELCADTAESRYVEEAILNAPEPEF